MAIGPGSRVGPYEITALIGEGGMGKVWRARHTALKRDDALKMLPDAFAADRERLARFQREAQVLASLNHPNIAHVYGLEEVDGTKALVLELVEGPTLAERIAQGPIPVNEALLIARQIAEALEAAHEQGIIHRDLKPANVKVRSDGTVKVLDFGLAKLVESHGAAGASAVAGALLSQSPTITNPAMITGVGMILGTAAYMSPEQARGKEVDKRADIWAFGVVLYEMLTGERPFTGEDVGETLAAVIKEQPEWHCVPAHVRPLLESCLEKDPRKRLRDIGDAWRLLENAGEDSASRSVRPQSSSRLPWGLAAAATLAFAGMTAYVLTRPAPASPSTQFTLEAPPSTIGFRFEVTGASVSPDGQLLVFSAFEGAERNSLYLRRLDSLEATPLPGTTNADFPFWSPDGRSIGFFADGNLKRIGIAGGPPVVLCEANGPGGGTWNRDGVIVFAARQGLFRVPASGGAPWR